MGRSKAMPGGGGGISSSAWRSAARPARSSACIASSSANRSRGGSGSAKTSSGAGGRSGPPAPPTYPAALPRGSGAAARPQGSAAARARASRRGPAAAAARRTAQRAPVRLRGDPGRNRGRLGRWHFRVRDRWHSLDGPEVAARTSTGRAYGRPRIGRHHLRDLRGAHCRGGLAGGGRLRQEGGHPGGGFHQAGMKVVVQARQALLSEGGRRTGRGRRERRRHGDPSGAAAGHAGR